MSLRYILRILAVITSFSLLTLSPAFAKSPLKPAIESHDESVKPKWDGAAYKSNSSLQQEVADWLAEHLAPKRAEKILDIGCGTGNSLRPLIRKYPDAVSFVGIDPDRSMLEQAADELGRNNIEFVQARAQDFTLTITFDLVVSSLSMHWIPESEQVKTLKNIWQHMAPGGTLAIVSAADKSDYPYGKALKDITSQPPYRQYFQHYQPMTHYFSLCSV